MAAAARISLHIHKLVSKKGHWFLKKAKILPKLFESLVNIVTSFVWLRLYWLRLRRRKPLNYLLLVGMVFRDHSPFTALGIFFCPTEIVPGKAGNKNFCWRLGE